MEMGPSLPLGPSLQAAALPLKPTPNPQNGLCIHLDGPVGNDLILLSWLLKFQWLHSRPKYLEVPDGFIHGRAASSQLPDEAVLTKASHTSPSSTMKW